jgi:hypothetical protein
MFVCNGICVHKYWFSIYDFNSSHLPQQHTHTRSNSKQTQSHHSHIPKKGYRSHTVLPTSHQTQLLSHLLFDSCLLPHTHTQSILPHKRFAKSMRVARNGTITSSMRLGKRKSVTAGQRHQQKQQRASERVLYTRDNNQRRETTKYQQRQRQRLRQRQRERERHVHWRGR